MIFKLPVTIHFLVVAVGGGAHRLDFEPEKKRIVLQ